MKYPIFRFIFYTLATIGLLISIYLFFRHLTLLDLTIGGSADFCSVIFQLSCDDALKSPIAELFGTPLAGWGIIYYFLIISIFSLGDFLKETFQDTAQDLLVLVTGITAVISSIFIIAFILNLIPFCPLCLLIHIINLTLFFVLIKLSLKSIPESLRSLYSGVKEFFVTKGPIPRQARQQIIALLLLAAFGLIIYQWIFMRVIRLELMEELKLSEEYSVEEEYSVDEEYSVEELRFLELYEKEKFVKFSASPDDPFLGPPNALVNMVVFSDFECSGCRKLSERIKTLTSKLRTELNVVYKHYPISTQCNGTVKRDLHPNSCQAAFAADAANRQGKFWEYHDLLFSSMISGEEEEFLEFAEILGLDISVFNEDMNSAAIEKVAEDINLGNEIGVNGTPAIYINGRRFKDLRLRSMGKLVETIHGILKKSSN